MIDKLLIANRGEIACRVMRTARRMGIRTVAVYSEADRRSLHVEMADEAYLVGPPSPAESYLNQSAILDAARRSGADAIHPGYGFLSENAVFARACGEAGIIFVGPPPEAIAAMGDKIGARRLMQKAGVPVVPGYDGGEQELPLLLQRGIEVGFPLLIKASAGGGGKGMRVVETDSELPEALSGARREAAAAFGNDTLLLERFLPGCRHVEIQVFADRQGNTVHLFERDCSVQRRYQKVMEEAPAPNFSPELRFRMGEAAVAAARTVGYVGAGTVEFLLSADGDFYFNEMNARLQVEHPVTEMITGLDLVEWQLRSAAGEPLPLRQEEIPLSGHAFEARLYAEDPERGFLPSTGLLAHLRFPGDGKDIRIDSGVREGDEILPFYDPLIAKIIARGDDRPSALGRLRRILAECETAGVTTNLPFLRRVAAHPAFASGSFRTRFIQEHLADLLPTPEPPGERTVALAALFLLLSRQGEERERTRASDDPYSPWGLADGWRAGAPHRHVLSLRHGEEWFTVAIDGADGRFLIDFQSSPSPSPSPARARLDGRNLEAEFGGETMRGTAIRHGRELFLIAGGTTWRFEVPETLTAEGSERSRGSLRAPMPGRIVALKAEAGEMVQNGAPLVVLEAMKMEHTVVAPGNGTVREMRFRVGDQVAEGEELLLFDAAGEDE